MKELDLHHTRHHEVQRKVDQFLYENMNNMPVKIITGYSERMKEIVIDTIKDYGYRYKIGDDLGFNQGFIKVF